MKLQVGQLAPEFILSDQDGITHKLSDYLGRRVLIYFYPKDDTPGCTQEACALRDNFPTFKKNQVEILGISADLIKSHKKFSEKYKLPFTLLADEEKKVVKDYGVWAQKKFMGKEYFGINRTSFLLDAQGKILKIYEKVQPDIHAEEVLGDLINK